MDNEKPIDDGGPVSGMTLRDLFAGSAMQGMVAGDGAKRVAERDLRYDETNWAAIVASNAYDFADAMLAARSIAASAERVAIRPVASEPPDALPSPGPWRLSAENPNAIADARGRWVMVRSENISITPEEADANCRLVAAVHEMAEFLKKVAACYGQHVVGAEARALLQKAGRR